MLAAPETHHLHVVLSLPLTSSSSSSTMGAFSHCMETRHSQSTRALHWVVIVGWQPSSQLYHHLRGTNGKSKNTNAPSSHHRGNALRLSHPIILSRVLLLLWIPKLCQLMLHRHSLPNFVIEPSLQNQPLVIKSWPHSPFPMVVSTLQRWWGNIRK